MIGLDGGNLMGKTGMGVRGKVLTVAIVGPVIIAIVLSVLRISGIKNDEVQAVVDKSR